MHDKGSFQDSSLALLDIVFSRVFGVAEPGAVLVGTAGCARTTRSATGPTSLTHEDQLCFKHGIPGL